MREKVEPTILSAHEAAGYAHICCRLTSSSTTTRIGSGKHCQYGVRAGKSRSQPGRLEIAKVYSTHTCPADVQKARTHDQTSVGTLRTLGKVVALREHLAQHQEKLSLAPSTTGDTTAPGVTRADSPNATVGDAPHLSTPEPQLPVLKADSQRTACAVPPELAYFLAGTTLTAAQQRTLATSLATAGVSNLSDLVHVLDFSPGIRAAFAAELLGSGREWPASVHVGTIGDAVEGLARAMHLGT